MLLGFNLPLVTMWTSWIPDQFLVVTKYWNDLQVFAPHLHSRNGGQFPYKLPYTFVPKIDVFPKGSFCEDHDSYLILPTSQNLKFRILPSPELTNLLIINLRSLFSLRAFKKCEVPLWATRLWLEQNITNKLPVSNNISLDLLLVFLDPSKEGFESPAWAEVYEADCFNLCGKILPKSGMTEAYCKWRVYSLSQLHLLILICFLDVFHFNCNDIPSFKKSGQNLKPFNSLFSEPDCELTQLNNPEQNCLQESSRI